MFFVTWFSTVRLTALRSVFKMQACCYCGRPESTNDPLHGVLGTLVDTWEMIFRTGPKTHSLQVGDASAKRAKIFRSSTRTGQLYPHISFIQFF